MAKIAGMKVKAYIGSPGTGTVIAGQRSATLNRSQETIDATSKDTDGYWKESLAGFKEWSIDFDGCYITDDASFAELEEAFMDGTDVDVYLEFPSGLSYAGKATITDFPIEAPYDDLITYSVSLAGNGALVKATRP